MKDIRIKYKTHTGAGADAFSFEVWGTSATGPERLLRSGSYNLEGDRDDRARLALDYWRQKYPEDPAEPKPPRLTIEVHTGALGAAFANVRLDGDPIRYFERYPSEQEARAAAEAYVEDLVKHFREGGR